MIEVFFQPFLLLGSFLYKLRDLSFQLILLKRDFLESLKTLFLLLIIYECLTLNKIEFPLDHPLDPAKRSINRLIIIQILLIENLNESLWIAAQN